jgi:Ca2+-binding EF-hand superfamily protein
MNKFKIAKSLIESVSGGGSKNKDKNKNQQSQYGSSSSSQYNNNQNQGYPPPQQHQGHYYSPQQQNHQGQGTPNRTQLDNRNYFRQIFDDMDTNRNGQIGPDELHEALRRGQPNAQFDARTVSILMEQYDRDRSGQIGFDEFSALFMGVNRQYNEFLDADADYSGTIDGNELTRALQRAGHHLSPATANFLASEICRRNNTSGINFDLYVRVLARMDFLRAEHQRTGQAPFDQFIRNSFF